MKEALALASVGGASCDELRDALVVTKTVAGVVAAAQTQLASAIAKTERHGDGGTGVLAETTGLTRREARGQVKTAQTISGVPSVRDAVSQGRVSLANAKRLADAVERTSAGAVEADGELLKMAESMRADQFTKQTRRWIAEQQDDGGEADYQRMRAKRSVRVWDNDNGMVELHATFDPLTGRRIGNRLRAEADRLYQNDKKHAAQQGKHHNEHERPGNPGEHRDKEASNSGPRGRPGGKHGNGRRGREPSNGRANASRRTFDQCMADALDNLTSNTATALATNTAPTTKRGTASAVSTATGTAARTGTGNGSGTRSCADTDTPSDGQAAMNANTGSGTGSLANTVTGEVDGGAGDIAGVAAGADPGTCTCGGRSADEGANSDVEADSNAGTGLGRSFADICVIVQVDAATGELVAQLPDGERLPASVLDKLTCNARISVILSTRRGQPIWRTFASRTATDTQRRLLLARWGGCFHCAAHPAMCQIHHIVPVAQGGETKIDNMIPVCWECHDLIHHNHWQIHKRPDGNHTLHPPQQRHHGPAHAPEQPLLFTQ